MSDSVPSEVGAFEAISEGGLNPDFRGNHNETILSLEVTDKKFKLRARLAFGIGLSVLLFAQNGALGLFLWNAYHEARIPEIATVFSVICTATLVETAAIVHTMVKWIFSDNEYRVR